MRLYVDLDNTLGYPLLRQEQLVGFIVRPTAEWFLRTLARHGDVWLLSSAERSHVTRALRTLGRAANVLRGTLTREDLLPVAEALYRISVTSRSEAEQDRKLSRVRKIARPGIMFDDFMVGTDMYLLKSKAIGIGENLWIQVEAFSEEFPDRGGLQKAYEQFLRRFSPRPVMGSVLAWS